MTRDEILAKLTGIFRDLFDDPTIVLTPETTANDIEEWDSMNHITLVVEAEQRFGIRFQTAELEKLKDIGEFVDVISRKLNARV
jgi:acyl carrier protein